ncbi:MULTISPECIES: hypothetical protein [unclassified Nostoc]|uniref:hypothetical protein n=1 Tax=unclassified Nostoc TaxID=2593658 RepID=UPI002AD448D6|nr:hypothetical protein [Nostoc sp. DedQUE03]MDZ7975723.1 hypothetical protein [Nostoc sp. DedQUE03]MDZ8048426.1 hypothetical protein [Nostoc sp. DedQUE02]
MPAAVNYALLNPLTRCFLVGCTHRPTRTAGVGVELNFEVAMPKAGYAYAVQQRKLGALGAIVWVGLHDQR